MELQASLQVVFDFNKKTYKKGGQNRYTCDSPMKSNTKEFQKKLSHLLIFLWVLTQAKAMTPDYTDNFFTIL